VHNLQRMAKEDETGLEQLFFIVKVFCKLFYNLRVDCPNNNTKSIILT